MFAVKLVGATLIVISSAFIGLLKSYALASRCKKLSLFFDGVNTLCESIEQSGDTLDIIIKNSFSKCGFLKCENGVFRCYDEHLKKDRSLIEEFFKTLGFLPKKIECDRINNFKIKLKTHINEAEDAYRQTGKVYGALGICAGLTIAILLI